MNRIFNQKLDLFPEHYKKWDKTFLRLAREISYSSKDPSTKVGAVITNQKNEIISMGYNGFPRKIKDDERLLNRKDKYSIIIHAEINSILFAKRDLEGYTIYTYPFQPCSNCASLIIQSGITRVVSLENNNQRWVDNFNLSSKIFYEAGVDLCLYKPSLIDDSKD